MKKFEVGKMYKLSGTGRCVECIKITECYVFFKENDGEEFKCKKMTGSNFIGKDVEGWETANHGKYHIRAID